MEPAGAAGAGIEPEEAVLFLLHILVGVAKHHRIHLAGARRELLFVVDQDKGHTAQGDCEVMGDGLGPRLVVVAPDDIQRSDIRHLVHNGLGVDVPGVKDGIGVFQVLHDLRPQQAMGVGENG